MTLIPNNLSIKLLKKKKCLASLIAACPTAQRQAQNCLLCFLFFFLSPPIHNAILQHPAISKVCLTVNSY